MELNQIIRHPSDQPELSQRTPFGARSAIYGLPLSLRHGNFSLHLILFDFFFSKYQ